MTANAQRAPLIAFPHPLCHPESHLTLHTSPLASPVRACSAVRAPSIPPMVYRCTEPSNSGALSGAQRRVWWRAAGATAPSTTLPPTMLARRTPHEQLAAPPVPSSQRSSPSNARARARPPAARATCAANGRVDQTACCRRIEQPIVQTRSNCSLLATLSYCRVHIDMYESLTVL